MAQDTDKRKRTRILPNLYGYDPDKNNWKPFALCIEHQKAYIVRIYDYFIDDRLSASSIASMLNKEQENKIPAPLIKKVFTSDFILKILKRLEYTGMTTDKSGERVPSTNYAQIIPMDRFEKAQEILSTRKQLQISGSNLKDYPLSGLLRCIPCNKPYYIKYPNVRNRTQYYYHQSIDEKDCISLIDADTLHDIVNVYFIEAFTSNKGWRKKYNYFQASWNARNQNSKAMPKDYLDFYPRIEVFKNSFEDYYLKFKEGEKTASQMKVWIEGTIEEIIEEDNEDMTKRFAEYLCSVLSRWYDLKKKEKPDLIHQYIEYAKTFKQFLLLSFSGYDGQRIKLNPISEELRKKIEHYERNRCLTKKDYKIKLKELTDYITKKSKDISIKQKNILFQIANSYDPELRKLGLINTIEPLELSCFYRVDWVSQTAPQKQYLYRNQETGKSYLRASKSDVEITPYFVGDRVFAFEKGRNIYFSTSFLHSLPEWFYSYGHEMFRTGKRKICFMIVDTLTTLNNINRYRIEAFELKRNGVKVGIGLRDAINSISKDTDAKFVDID